MVALSTPALAWDSTNLARCWRMLTMRSAAPPLEGDAIARWPRARCAREDMHWPGLNNMFYGSPTSEA
eukprot:39232-Pyramimonas_sp.AAC.1